MVARQDMDVTLHHGLFHSVLPIGSVSSWPAGVATVIDKLCYYQSSVSGDLNALRHMITCYCTGLVSHVHSKSSKD